MKTSKNKEEKETRNEDPHSGAPGAHPTSTGAGAVLGGLAGAAIGTLVGGPVGAAAGASMVAGAVAGGLVGKFTGEAIDPTIEEAYWRERHYLESHAVGQPYEEFEPAYRAGYEGYARHGGKEFTNVEADIQKDYESHRATVPWEKARPASKAAWQRVYNRNNSEASRE